MDLMLVDLMLGLAVIGLVVEAWTRHTVVARRLGVVEEVVDTLPESSAQEPVRLTAAEHLALAGSVSTLANLGETERNVVLLLPSKDLVTLAIHAVDQFYSDALAESLHSGRGSGPAHNPEGEKGVEDLLEAWQ